MAYSLGGAIGYMGYFITCPYLNTPKCLASDPTHAIVLMNRSYNWYSYFGIVSARAWNHTVSITR